MADVIANERLEISHENEPAQNNNNAFDLVKIENVAEEHPKNGRKTDNNESNEERKSVKAAEQSVKAAEQSRKISRSLSVNVSDSIDTSEQLSERTLRRKKSKFIATSTRHAVTNIRDQDFNEILHQAVVAIKEKTFPKLIPAGSSGSYFVFDKEGTPIAVFKPKDEEPFAELNPKWPKFFQRILCFCCFGRNCLIPNNGYLSETGASLVDDRLGLNVVPKTRVVKLESPTFFYGRGCFNKGMKPKEGSFQLFVHGYRSATEVLAEWSNNPLSSEESDAFLLLFQKLCVLDYAIRNTDRHTDNWLIKHVPGEELLLAAIDNGLAFPVKHPECASRFRTFPFAWAALPFAQHPLLPQLREKLLNLLTPLFVHNLCDDLKTLFRHDKSTNRLLSHSQIRVFRGQLYNLREGLEANESPAEWVKRRPVMVTRKYRKQPTTNDWSQCFRKRAADYRNRGCC